LPVEGLLGKGYHVLNYAKKNLLTEQISLKWGQNFTVIHWYFIYTNICYCEIFFYKSIQYFHRGQTKFLLYWCSLYTDFTALNRPRFLHVYEVWKFSSRNACIYIASSSKWAITKQLKYAKMKWCYNMSLVASCVLV
jgi:hypothetical protein